MYCADSSLYNTLKPPTQPARVIAYGTASTPAHTIALILCAADMTEGKQKVLHSLNSPGAVAPQMQSTMQCNTWLCVQDAEKYAGTLAQEVKRAAEHTDKLAQRARVAESAQKEAQSQLKSAGLEASTARKLVEAVSTLLESQQCLTGENEHCIE